MHTSPLCPRPKIGWVQRSFDLMLTSYIIRAHPCKHSDVISLKYTEYVEDWISGFQIGFLDFRVYFRISLDFVGFLDFCRQTPRTCMSVFILDSQSGERCSPSSLPRTSNFSAYRLNCTVDAGRSSHYKRKL